MKWFFALSVHTSTYPYYAELVKVAVLSARACTSLEPNFIYNSPMEDDLVQWLRKHGVKVWYQPSFLEKKLKRLAEEKNNPHIFSIGSGAFLRCEIPALVRKNIGDKFILYTDCDVLFRGDVAELEAIHPRYFAIAPEFDRNDYQHANTGVMIMNINRLYRWNLLFKRYIALNLDKLVSQTWDQTAYLNYFQGRFTKKPLWGRLPLQYNWKTYWGDYSDAKIIHFHGLKPFDRKGLELRVLPQILLDMETPEYHELTEIYYTWLSQA